MQKPFKTSESHFSLIRFLGNLFITEFFLMEQVNPEHYITGNTALGRGVDTETALFLVRKRASIPKWYSWGQII